MGVPMQRAAPFPQNPLIACCFGFLPSKNTGCTALIFRLESHCWWLRHLFADHEAGAEASGIR